MSKAILVMEEMPASCYQCYLNNDWNVCIVDAKKAPFEDVRPGHCPLIEMPERETSDTSDEWEKGYARGWNSFRRQIGGEN